MMTRILGCVPPLLLLLPLLSLNYVSSGEFPTATITATTANCTTIGKNGTCMAHETYNRFVYSPTSTVLLNNTQRGPSTTMFVHRMANTFLQNLISLALPTNVEHKCMNDLTEMQRGIDAKTIWAIKALDASGRPGAGFIWGNNYWLGSQDGCTAVNTPPSITLSPRYHRHMIDGLIDSPAPIAFEYTIIYVEHRSPWQVEIKFLYENMLHIGVCMPASCSTHDIANLTSIYLTTHTMADDIFTDFIGDVTDVKQLKLRDGFFSKWSVQCLMVIFCLTATLCWLATVKQSRNNNNTHPDGVDQLNNDEPTMTLNKVQPQHQPLIDQMLSCFSISANVADIISTKSDKNAIGGLDGLRTISCIWILAFHVIWYYHYTLNAKAMMFANFEKLFMQLITNGVMLVDVFFTISGFLLAYNFLKDTTRFTAVKTSTLPEMCVMFGKSFGARLLRIIPLYFFLILCTEVATVLLVDLTPFHVSERFDLTCSKHWWRNVLFINNWFSHTEFCLGWSWSLACEMQYFIFFTIFLFIYAKNSKLAKKLFVGLFAFVFIYSLASVLSVKFVPTYDVLFHAGDVWYTDALIRSPPYFCGVFAGWFLSRTKDRTMFTKTESRNYGIASFLFVLFMFFSTTYRNIPYWLASLFLVITRFTFGTTVSWLIYSFAKGNGGWLRKFMEGSLFTHIGKLSYGIYLWNPLLITILHGFNNNSTNFDVPSLFVTTAGTFVFVYGISFVSAIFIELPYQKLSKIIFSNVKLKSAEHKSS